VSLENFNTASVSYQSLFGYYRRLAGMTVRLAANRCSNTRCANACAGSLAAGRTDALPSSGLACIGSMQTVRHVCHYSGR